MEKKNTSIIQKLSISYECALAIGNSLNLSEMLHNVIHTIVRKTNAHRGSIWLLDEKKKKSIKLGARAGSRLTEAEINEKISSFYDIFEKIWDDQKLIIKRRDEKDFSKYCNILTGKEQSVLIIPINNIAMLDLVYASKEIVDETLGNILVGLSQKLSVAIDACLAHENIKEEIQVRRKTEELLKHSEQQYRTTVDSIGRAIHVVDENLSILFFNETFKQWNKELGFETKNLIGRNLFDIFPFLSDSVRDVYQQVFDTGKMLITIETNELAGKRIITETRKIPILENNKVVRVITVIDDITERKLAEDALRESEEKFKALFKKNPAPQVYIDENLRILDINSHFKELFGYELDELKGKNIDDVVVPKGMMEEAEEFNKRAKKGYFYQETVRKSKDGKNIPVSISGIPITLKGRKQYITIYEDITERKKAENELEKKTNQLISHRKKVEKLYGESEEARKSLLSILEDVTEKENDLRESEERFQNIVTNTGDWIWETDTKGRYTYSSPIIKQVLGYDYKEMLGKHFYDFFHPEEREKLKNAAFVTFRKKESFKNFINRNVHKDGHTVILETSGVPILDDNGNLLGYRGVDRDITERKRAEIIQKSLYQIATSVLCR